MLVDFLQQNQNFLIFWGNPCACDLNKTTNIYYPSNFGGWWGTPTHSFDSCPCMYQMQKHYERTANTFGNLIIFIKNLTLSEKHFSHSIANFPSQQKVFLQFLFGNKIKSSWKTMEATKKIRVATSYLPSDPTKPPRIVISFCHNLEQTFFLIS
jgi:hypothetical protein